MHLLLLLRNEERLGDLEGLLLVEVQKRLEEGKELFKGNHAAAIVKGDRESSAASQVMNPVLLEGRSDDLKHLRRQLRNRRLESRALKVRSRWMYLAKGADSTSLIHRIEEERVLAAVGLIDHCESLNEGYFLDHVLPCKLKVLIDLVRLLRIAHLDPALHLKEPIEFLPVKVVLLEDLLEGVLERDAFSLLEDGEDLLQLGDDLSEGLGLEGKG